MILDAYNEFIDSHDAAESQKIRTQFEAVQNGMRREPINVQPEVSVYYDAWSNDNDIDSMLSLVYEILQTVNTDYSFKKSADGLKIATAIADFFTSKKVTTLVEAFTQTDILAALKEQKSIHIITTAIEHHSILNACHALESMGVEITFLPVDNGGMVSVERLKSAIRPNTKLVSVMLANNEIRTIQPVAEIGELLSSRGILLHTDAVQVVGHIPVNVNELQVGFLSASAHKFNGAKGTGFLYIRSGLSLPNLVFGGEQENGHRAGTENVAGIVATGFALMESVANMQQDSARLREMTQKTTGKIREQIHDVRLNGCQQSRLPGTISLGFNGVSGETLMNLLDLKGICVSTSSACNSGKNEPSHVLLALGQSEQQANSTIRISYGRYNTTDESDVVARAVCNAYDKIKSVNQLK